jgi:competence protein ComEC
VGRDNEYGQPHPQTLALVARRGIPLWRTDVDGTVTVQSDGKRWDVVTYPEPARGPRARTKAAN